MATPIVSNQSGDASPISPQPAINNRSLQPMWGTAEGAALMDALVNSNGGIEGLPLEALLVKRAAVHIAAMRLLTDSPDRTSLIARELAKMAGVAGKQVRR